MVVKPASQVSFTQSFAEIDRLINRVVRENGRESYPLILSELKRNIKANITYYENIAETAENQGLEKAANFRLIAQIYEQLLPRDE